MAKEPTLEKSRPKASQREQIMNNAIERRLSLPGGTLPTEVGADLANRLGQAHSIIGRLNGEMEALQVTRSFPATHPAYMHPETFKNQLADLRRQVAEAKELRIKEIRDFTEYFLQYVTDNYGAEKRDGIGYIVGYGDRLEVLKNGHIKKRF